MAKQKQTVKLKEPVRIRFKQLSNGNQSIYLEYYTGDVIRKENYVGGKRKYEMCIRDSAGAVVGAEDLGLSDWLRTVDLQCRL